LNQGFGDICFRYPGETGGQSISLIVGSEKMSGLVEGRFVNVRKVRREMGHIECASHSCVDRAVFTSSVPLRDQPDLLNSLGPRLRRENCIDRGVDCHGSAQASTD